MSNTDDTFQAQTCEALNRLADAVGQLADWVLDHTPGEDHSCLDDVRGSLGEARQAIRAAGGLRVE